MNVDVVTKSRYSVDGAYKASTNLNDSNLPGISGGDVNCRSRLN